MAVIETTRPITGGHLFGGRFRNILSAFAAWNDVRATRNALSALSDRELYDIGLLRGDIEGMGR